MLEIRGGKLATTCRAAVSEQMKVLVGLIERRLSEGDLLERGTLERDHGAWRTDRVLIVVFGILIALGVHRWNERRQARATESAYMEALARDLESDTAALGTLVRMYRTRRDADSGALSWDVNDAGWVTSFDPTDFTYRELVATGGLALIRDVEL